MRLLSILASILVLGFVIVGILYFDHLPIPTVAEMRHNYEVAHATP